MSNRIDSTDGSRQPPEWAVAGDPHLAAFWQDVHPMLFDLPLSWGLGCRYHRTFMVSRSFALSQSQPILNKHALFLGMFYKLKEKNPSLQQTAGQARDGFLFIRNRMANRCRGYEAMNMLRKGQICGVEKRDNIKQVAFIASLFGVAV